MSKYLNSNKFVALVAGMALPMAMMAAPVGPERAKEIAKRSFSAEMSAAHKAPAQIDFDVVYSGGTAAQPTYYVLNENHGAGFMIVSGDDRLPEVLGYSEEGSFDINNVPCNVQWWLDFYTSEIEHFYSSPALQAAQQSGSNAFRAPMMSIAPMVTTKWNQDTPYNNLCPRDGQALSVTGCVATAMAQVMKYHEWPNEPHGESGGVLFDGTTYQWKSMKDEYIVGKYTPQEANAVATLMRQCGASVNMQYSSWASGAYSADVQYAWVNYFDYNKGMRLEYRDTYSFSEWNHLVYTELAAGRPMYYSGQATDGGHAFVCDGYRGSGLFHFNWGWGGAYDGYFILSALNPSGGGIGSYEGGYNTNQMIIAGVEPQPKATGPQEQQITMVPTGGFSYQGGTFRVVDGPKYGNQQDNRFYNPHTYTITITKGVKITNARNAEKVYYAADRSGMLPYAQWEGFSAIQPSMPTDLPDGTYYVTPAILPEGRDWIELRAVNSKQTYVEMTVAEGRTTYTNPDITNKVAELIACGMEYAPEMQGSGPVVVRFFIANVGNNDYFGNIKVRLEMTADKDYNTESTLMTSIPMQATSTVTFQEVVGLNSDCLFTLFDDQNKVIGTYPIYLTPLARDERSDRVNRTTLNIGAIAPNFADKGTPYEAGFWVSNPVNAAPLNTGLNLQLCKYGTKQVVSEQKLDEMEFAGGDYVTLTTPTTEWSVDPGYYYWLLRRDNGDYLAGPWALLLTSAAVEKNSVNYYVYDSDKKLAYVGNSEEYNKNVVVENSIDGSTVDHLYPGAFTFATEVESLTLPESISEYGPAAFYCMENLKTLAIKSNTPPALDSRSFSAEGFKNIALSVPTPNVYKRTSLWEKFTMPTWSISLEDGITYDSGLEMDGATWYNPYYVCQGQQLTFKVKAPQDKPVAAICTIDGQESAVWCAEGKVKLPALGKKNGSVRLTTNIPDGVEVLASADNYNVFTLMGVQVLRGATREEFDALPAGLYILNGRKVLKK